MNVLDQIRERIAYQLSYWEDEPSVIHMRLSAGIVSGNGKVEERAEVPLITCKDCKYGKAIESIGCLMFNHVESRLQPKDPDGFCAWAERG